jgi:hypothetical protein
VETTAQDDHAWDGDEHVAVNSSPEEISRLLMAAGLVEQARDHLRMVHDKRDYRSYLKRIADDLAAEAVAEKVKIANNIEQHFGRED